MVETGPSANEKPIDLLNSGAVLNLGDTHPSYLHSGIPTELSDAPIENHGLMAVLDLGGKVESPSFRYGEAAKKPQTPEEHLKMLLVVDLDTPDGERWIEGRPRPEGAKVALIDPKGLQIDENGAVTKGIMFVGRGEQIDVGRVVPHSQKAFDIKGAASVSANHLSVAVTKDGKVCVQDRGSTNGTIVSTGEYARDAVNEIGEHHEYHERFKQIIGEKVLENVVSPVSPVEAFDQGEHIVSHEKVALKNQKVEINIELMGKDQYIDVELGSPDTSLRISVKDGEVEILGLSKFGGIAGAELSTEGDSYSIGREPQNTLAAKDRKVSKNHANIYIKNGSLFVEDLNSLNGTTLELFTDTEQTGEDPAHYEYTTMVQLEAQQRQTDEMRRGEKPRHSIGKDTRIDGGVYELSANIEGGEVIIVDKEKYPYGYEPAMNEVKGAIASQGDISVLRAVYDVVMNKLVYDLDSVDTLNAKFTPSSSARTTVSLEAFLRQGVGVCRHQALFAAQLLEGLIDEGRLRGKVSVDRSVMSLPDGGVGGHAWARFTSEIGEVFILDVAQHKLGPLGDLVEERKKGGGSLGLRASSRKEAKDHC